MNDLSKAERFKKCLNCGSEEHRAADCKATRRKDLAQQEPKSKPQVAQVSQPASSALPIAQATPLMSMDSFLQQATQALRQMEASHAAAGVPPQAIAQVAAPITPTPEGGGQHQPSPSPPQPSIKRLAITSIMPASSFQASHLESQNLGTQTPILEPKQGSGSANRPHGCHHRAVRLQVGVVSR